MPRPRKRAAARAKKINRLTLRTVRTLKKTGTRRFIVGRKSRDLFKKFSVKIASLGHSIINSASKNKIKYILPYYKRMSGSALIAVGIILIAFPVIFKSIMAVRTDQSAIHPLSAGESAGKPSLFDPGPIKIDTKLLTDRETAQPPLRIVIPEKGIDLSITEANVFNGFWELSETTASHGVGSANPGERGNTVIFAHARKGLFLEIRDIKVLTPVYVLTKDRWYRYQVTDTKLVMPNEIEHIGPTEDEMLTLFTCSGFLDSKRLIVHAKPYRP